MAVTLNSTGITFSNGQSLNSVPSAGTTLSSVQYGPYYAQTLAGFQNFNTGVVDIFDGPRYGPIISNVSTANTVVCGFQAYKSGNNTGNDNIIDSGTIQHRLVYRTIS